MVANQHFQRLKHIYDADPADISTGRVAISYGYAQIDGVIEDRESGGVVNRMPQQKLLSDAASLAAGSVEKERVLTAEHFNVSVEEPAYRGTVVATAEVMVAEPPRYHVHAMLLSESGTVVAEALGVFMPSEEVLPPDPSPEEEEETPAPPPASFMPVYATEHGVLCLN